MDLLSTLSNQSKWWQVIPKILKSLKLVKATLDREIGLK
jgi:hypothetical protein